MHLTIKDDTPRIVWDGVVREKHESVGLAELPSLRVWWVAWNDRNDLQRALGDVMWPDYLRELSIGDGINQLPDGVVFPCSANELPFRGESSRLVVRVSLPLSLQKLTSGAHFDPPVESIVWLSSLEQLTLGRAFNQPIERAVWPSFLLQLTLGRAFDHPIKRAEWPSSLQQLTLGVRFNRPMEGVA